VPIRDAPRHDEPSGVSQDQIGQQAQEEQCGRRRRDARCWCGAVTMSAPFRATSASPIGQQRPRTSRSRPDRPHAAAVTQIAGCRARASGARSPHVHMQTTPFSVSFGESSPGPPWLSVGPPLVSASGLGGERQSDRECPNGDGAAATSAGLGPRGALGFTRLRGTGSLAARYRPARSCLCIACAPRSAWRCCWSSISPVCSDAIAIIALSCRSSSGRESRALAREFPSAHRRTVVEVRGELCSGIWVALAASHGPS
jgi:hypothetical protein